MSQKHKTYREIRQEFSAERQQKISADAAKINNRLLNSQKNHQCNSSQIETLFPEKPLVDRNIQEAPLSK
jgi:hypothetical protein